MTTSVPDPPSTKKGVVCVFCGASPGSTPAHMAAARALARALHAADLALVYGGGTVGLMGEVARTLVSLAGPGRVHGVIPEALIKYEQGVATTADDQQHRRRAHEAAYGRVTVVRDMHARKARMAREVMDGGAGGGFVALSGGFGTLEELMEVTTWNQLGIHSRPVVVFNVAGYWDGLMAWLRTAIDQGFVREGCKGIMVEATDAEGCVRALEGYRVADERYDLQWEEL